MNPWNLSRGATFLLTLLCLQAPAPAQAQVSADTSGQCADSGFVITGTGQCCYMTEPRDGITPCAMYSTGSLFSPINVDGRPLNGKAPPLDDGTPCQFIGGILSCGDMNTLTSANVTSEGVSYVVSTFVPISYQGSVANSPYSGISNGSSTTATTGSTAPLTSKRANPCAPSFDLPENVVYSQDPFKQGIAVCIAKAAIEQMNATQCVGGTIQDGFMLMMLSPRLLKEPVNTARREQLTQNLSLMVDALGSLALEVAYGATPMGTMALGDKVGKWLVERFMDVHTVISDQGTKRAAATAEVCRAIIQGAEVAVVATKMAKVFQATSKAAAEAAAKELKDELEKQISQHSDLAIKNIDTWAQLGSGNYGTVYRFRDHTTGKDVALKVAKDKLDPKRVEKDIQGIFALKNTGANSPSYIGLVDVCDKNGTCSKGIMMTVMDGKDVSHSFNFPKQAPGDYVEQLRRWKKQGLLGDDVWESNTVILNSPGPNGLYVGFVDTTVVNWDAVDPMIRNITLTRQYNNYVTICSKTSGCSPMDMPAFLGEVQKP